MNKREQRLAHRLVVHPLHAIEDMDQRAVVGRLGPGIPVLSVALGGTELLVPTVRRSSRADKTVRGASE